MGIAGGLDTSPQEPWARAGKKEEEVRAGGVHGDEEQAGPKYNAGEHPGAPSSGYGDEGGGGP